MSRSSAARDLSRTQNGRSRSSAAAQDADSGRFRRGGRNKAGKAGLDWQDTDWGKVSDEQYWAELSSDKPLATTARSAQSAASLAAATRDRPAEQAEHDPAGRGPAQGLGQLARRRRPVRAHEDDDAAEPAVVAAQDPDTDPGADGPARWPDASDPSLPTSSWPTTSRSDTAWPPPRESAAGWTPADSSEAAWTAPEDAPAAWTPREEPTPAWASEEPSAAAWTAPESSGDRWTPSEEPAAWTPSDEASAAWTPSDEASAAWTPSDEADSARTASDASGSAWTPSDAPAPGGWEPPDAAAWPAHEPATASWAAEDPLTSPSYAAQSAQADSRSYGKSHRRAQPAGGDSSGGYDYPSDPAWNGNGASHNGATHNGGSHEAYSGGWSPDGDDYGSLEPLPEHGGASHGAAEDSPGPAENWYQAPVSSDAPAPYPASRNGTSEQPGFGYQDAPAYQASQPRHGNGYSDRGHQGWASDGPGHNGYSHSNGYSNASGYSPDGYDAGHREDSYHRADPGYPAEPPAYSDYSADPGYPAGHDYASDQAYPAYPAHQAHQAYSAESGYEPGPAGYDQPADYLASRPPYDHGAGYEPYPGYEGDRR